jgi:CBS domain-containing protein
MKLKDAMTKQVVSVRPFQNIGEAAKIMSDNNVGAVPVVEKGQVVGILTDRDIAIRAVARNLGPSTEVRDIMTKNVVTADSHMDVQDAVNLMAENQIRRLPVIDNAQLGGIISLGDVAISNGYQEEAGEALTDISKPE